MTALPDITRFRGDTVADKFKILDSQGAPVNLTGFTVTMTLDAKPHPIDTSTQVYSITGTVTNPASGEVECKPSALQSDQPAGTSYYDVQLRSDTGDLQTVGIGRYIYIQDIGKST